MELYRPPDGYFGFQISPTIQDNKLRVFISGFGHGLTDKLFTGLLAVSKNYIYLHKFLIFFRRLMELFIGYSLLYIFYIAGVNTTTSRSGTRF